MKANNKYFSPSSGTMSIKQVVLEISKFIDEDPEKFYSVLIGSDSQSKRINGVSEIDFVNAIVVHRRGSGGRYFWRKERVVRKPVLREKIYTETQMSLECAEKLVPLLRAAISPAKYDLQIHIDVGALGPTREMIREVVGMVQGSGYVAKTKPESWAASSVADKYT